MPEMTALCVITAVAVPGLRFTPSIASSKPDFYLNRSGRFVAGRTFG